MENAIIVYWEHPHWLLILHFILWGIKQISNIYILHKLFLYKNKKEIFTFLGKFLMLSAEKRNQFGSFFFIFFTFEKRNSKKIKERGISRKLRIFFLKEINKILHPHTHSEKDHIRFFSHEYFLFEISLERDHSYRTSENIILGFSKFSPIQTFARVCYSKILKP